MTARFAIFAAPGTGSADTGLADTGLAGTGLAGTGLAGTGLAGTVGARLRERAERWLGRGVAGNPVTPLVPAGWTRAAVDAMTVDARRYGFHGTLKAPFRLAEGRTPEELDAAVARFAAGTASAEIPSLTLARLGPFFALVPGAAAPGLDALADEVVKEFDDFRAPANEAELARRNPDALTPRQRELLTAWGYPYVLDEFRFHLTLTDRIPTEERPRVERTLSDWFAPVLGAAVPVDALALFKEAAPGAPFALYAVHQLRPATGPRSTPATPDREGAR